MLSCTVNTHLATTEEEEEQEEKGELMVVVFLWYGSSCGGCNDKKVKQRYEVKMIE
jgi:hypothetical protein